MIHGPFGQFAPIVHGASVDREPQFRILILALLQILHHLLEDHGEELALDVVVGFEENVPQQTLPDGIVLGVELVEAVEGVAVRVHVQHVHVEVVGRQVHAAEHLRQRHGLQALLVDHHVLVRVHFHLALDETEQVLLVHGGRRVDMAVHFADVVKVAVRHELLRGHLAVFVEVRVQGKFGLQEAEFAEAEGFSGTRQANRWEKTINQSINHSNNRIQVIQ